MEKGSKSIPQWLQNLQENSWEIELLISGGAVFTLLQFPEMLLSFFRFAQTTSDIPGLHMMLIMGMAGLKILTNGFILHLLLRSFWLAMVCINYIFPEGINSLKMKRTFPFQSRHLEGDLQEQIMDVDRLSGLVIFMTIISTLVLAGLVLGFFVTVFLIEWLNKWGLWFSYFDLLFGLFSLLYFLDLLAMGSLRKIPLLSWVLFPIFWFFDLISLRSFYARPLALFSSNIHRAKFFGGALVFVLITGISTYVSLAKPMHWPRILDDRMYKNQLTRSGQKLVNWYYLDKTEPGKTGLVYIPSQLIEHNYLPITIQYDRWMDRLLDYSNPKKSDRFLSELIEVAIDDSVYHQVEWLESRELAESTMGLVSMIDISHLSNGPHSVRIQSKNLPNPEYQRIREETIYEVSIPFWKDVH